MTGIPASGALSYMLTGLENNQWYLVQTRAVNAYGAPAWGDGVTVTGGIFSTSSAVPLSGITVEGGDIADFAPDTTIYTVGVNNSAATPTIVATVADNGAVVSYSPDDADTETNGHQVAVEANGSATVIINVTNGTETGAYIVTVNRGRDGRKEWLASKDIYGLPAALGENKDGRGIWSDGKTLWAVNSAVSNSGLWAFDLETGGRASNADIAVGTLTHTIDGQARSVEQPWDLAGADGDIWVTSTDPLHAALGYRLDDEGVWQADDDLVNRCGSTATRSSLWVDGETIWIGEGGVLRAYRFDCETDSDGNALGSLPSLDLNLSEENEHAAGVWTDGNFWWVADREDEMLYAYDALTKQRAAAMDFDAADLAIQGAEISPWGIWSDGETMWVLDSNENIYSYRMPLSDNADLAWVRFEGVNVMGFDANQLERAVGVPNDATTGSITTKTRHSGATASNPSQDIDLSTGPATFRTTVTAQDGTTTKDYTLTVGRIPGPTTITSVEAQHTGTLTVTVSPPDAGSADDVDSCDFRIAKAPEAGDPVDWGELHLTPYSNIPCHNYKFGGLTTGDTYLARVRARNRFGTAPWPADDDVAEGTAIEVEVGPDYYYSGVAGSVIIYYIGPPTTVEGDDAVFNLRRFGDNSGTLDVNLIISEFGTNVVKSDDLGTRMVTFSANNFYKTFSISTKKNDTYSAKHPSVKMEILGPSPGGDHYTPGSPVMGGSHGGYNVMEVTVLDDEFPPGVTLEMSADDTSVEEGESATLTLTFQTQPLDEPHADAGTFTLSVTGDSGDYTLSPTEITVPASAFEQIGYDSHVGETQRGPFTATVTSTFTALEDEIAEPNEDFTISVARGTGAQTSIDLPDDLTLRILGARSSDLPEFSIRSGQGDGTLPTESDGSISFEITRPRLSMSDVRLTVRVSEDGNMIRGSRSQDRTITIGRNSTTRRIHVQLQNDGQNEAHSNITAQILGGEGYEVSPTGGSAVQQVMDDDSPNPKFSIRSGHSPLLIPTESDGPVIFEITRPGTSTSDVAITVSVD